MFTVGQFNLLGFVQTVVGVVLALYLSKMLMDKMHKKDQSAPAEPGK